MGKYQAIKESKDDNTLPKYIMVENVKNLVSKKFIEHFNNLISVFDDLGFNTYWSVLNGKDCGVPQNRERVFVIAIRKDIDNGTFYFPKPFDTGIRLKDVLEKNVDEKYYLSEVAQKRFKFTNESFLNNIIGTIETQSGKIHQKDVVYNQNGIVNSLLATDYKQPKQVCIDKSINNTSIIEYANCITSREDRGISNRKSEGTAVLEQIGQLYGTEKEPNPQAGRVYSSECLSPTIDTCSGGNRMPKIVQVGQVSNDGSQAGKVYSTEGISQTICACTHGYAIGNILDNIRIRKLTPRECYKLMGLTFEDCDKARNIGVADTHLYKQAGNGIITNCCELLAEHLYKAQYDNTYICTDENFQKPQVE